MSSLPTRPVLIAAAFIAAVGAPAAAFELAFPVECAVGVDCAIQHYVDRDPGPGIEDFRCGSQTYEAHDGTDIRVPTLRRMTSGVPVVAAADGRVARTRDGMPDESIADAGSAGVVKDRECGNGVFIEHDGGWVTQYCHMKRGSIRVKSGDRVAARTAIGEIGLSGNTEFPHLHFTVRKDDKPVDPFGVDRLASGAACQFAGDDRSSLWTPEAKAQLAYRPAFILNAGFADRVMSMAEVESGESEDIRLMPDSPALVFFGRAIGIEKGDVQRLVLTGPDGQVFVENEVEPTDRVKAQVFAFVGKKRRDQAWPPGRYRGRYSVIRGGAEIAFKEAETEILP